jgi:hypothetical protein
MWNKEYQPDKAPRVQGIVLRRQPDETLFGTCAQMPLIDVRATFDADASAVMVEFSLAGVNVSLTKEALKFPFLQGAASLVCESDLSLILVRTRSDTAPYVLSRAEGASMGSAPW